MPRIWLHIIVSCSLSIYLLESIQADVCTCTISACITTQNKAHNRHKLDKSPFFIERAPGVSNQVRLVTSDAQECTRLCQTITQLYSRVWGITLDKSRAEFTA